MVQSMHDVFLFFSEVLLFLIEIQFIFQWYTLLFILLYRIDIFIVFLKQISTSDLHLATWGSNPFSSFIVDIDPASQGCHPISVNIGLDSFHAPSHVRFEIEKFWLNFFWPGGIQTADLSVAEPMRGWSLAFIVHKDFSTY